MAHIQRYPDRAGQSSRRVKPCPSSSFLSVDSITQICPIFSLSLLLALGFPARNRACQVVLDRQVRCAVRVFWFINTSLTTELDHGHNELPHDAEERGLCSCIVSLYIPPSRWRSSSWNVSVHPSWLITYPVMSYLDSRHHDSILEGGKRKKAVNHVCLHHQQRHCQHPRTHCCHSVLHQRLM